MLAAPGDKPFQDADWIYEPKLDGYRIVAVRNGDQVRLTSRGGADFAGTFPAIAAALRALPHRRLVLDGELVGFDEQGKPSFAALQGMSKKRIGGKNDRAVLFVFDLLHIEGVNTRGQPQTERRRMLEAAVQQSAYLQLVHAQDDGTALFDAAAKMGMEGIVAKRKDAVYRPGARSAAWLKILAFKRADMLVLGYTGFGRVESLLVGYRRSGRLKYAASVTGLGALAMSLLPVLQTLPGAPACARIAGARWLRPMLVVEVRYRELTRDGKLRHATFYRLGEEIAPAEGDFPPVVLL